MQRPDLRQISGNIREALADCDREALLDMLTFVFKEYVVEGPPPILLGQAERIADLEGLSFAALVKALQLRLDVPELGLLHVDGDQVQVRVGGVLTPLDAAAARPASAAPAPSAPPASAGTPAGQAQAETPGVRVVETQFTRRPIGAPASFDNRPRAAEPAAESAPAQDDAQRQAPLPRGLSIRGRRVGSDDTSPDRPTRPPQRRPEGASSARPNSPGAAPAAARDAADAPKPETPKSSDRDAASERFSLLELD